MTLDLMKEQGIPLDAQVATWRELVRTPISKLDDDAFTRMRVLLMASLEAEAVRFSHSCARLNRHLQLPLAQVRRAEQHQRTLVGWLLPPDLSQLETTLSYEQLAVELAGMMAQQEPDPYMAQVYRFGMLEDLDHLYRFAALLDRVDGRDANNILQSYTDICPGRATRFQHRAPEDDLRENYERKVAHFASKLHALSAIAVKQQMHEYYMTVGPQHADPVARQLFAEIASVEEQHLTHCESTVDAAETWLEKWVLHEACEVYQYYGCVEHETSPQVKAVWERLLACELGHLHFAIDLFERQENRDIAEILPSTLPVPLSHGVQRDFVREVAAVEIDLRAAGARFIDKGYERSEAAHSMRYRDRINRDGCPSEAVASGYRWTPGTELVTESEHLRGRRGDEVRL
ncbi:MAG TPA: hypothetical protein VFH51_02350 [Myxococcota bacterium]|nr:hypothetical protein [Myxococcota bacterium]